MKRYVHVDMLDDRYYMRQTPFEVRRSATMMLLVANVIAFVVECFIYGYPPLFRGNDLLALSWYGIKHGYVWQLLTFQFLHGGLLHLVLNGLAIFFMGPELERTLGVKKFLALYFSSGILGGLFQVLAAGVTAQFPESAWAMRFAGPTVGASAGAFGLVAAFATLFPERPLTLLLFFVIPVNLRAKFLLWISAGFALFGILMPPGAGPGPRVADAAHLGGMLAGVLFARFAAVGEWHWPSLRRSRRPTSRRLVRVSSGSSALWGRNKGAETEELPPEQFLSKEVDPILDKISAHGIQSLTDRERRILESAREKMGRR